MRFWVELPPSGHNLGIGALRPDGPRQQQGRSRWPDPALHPDRQYGGQARAATYRRAFLILAWITGAILTLTVPVAAQGVCNRTPQVRDKLVHAAGVSTCAEVTTNHLAAIRFLDLRACGIRTLRAGDFDGLSSLSRLRLHENHLTTLPKGIFNGLHALEQLSLTGNQLPTLPDGVFHGLRALQFLRIDSNPLTTLPKGIFSGLHALKDLWLAGNQLSTVPQGIFHGLPALQVLILSWNQLTTLPVDIFTELDALKLLGLSGNQLASVPSGIFNGLRSLQVLALNDNPSLTTLPTGTFGGLDSLTYLILDGTSLSELSPGMFDDVLDTLGGYIVKIRGIATRQGTLVVDDYLKATLAFGKTAQKASRGDTVQVAATLSRALPVAVRVPYRLQTNARSDDYTGLSPSPSEGLLFRAGETRQEITLTLAESYDPQDKIIELTLGDLSQIGLRRSGGSGPDAPHLKAESLIDRAEEGFKHTIIVAASSPGICDRTPQVRDKLLEITKVSSCESVTQRDLDEVAFRGLYLEGAGIARLRVGDFDGLGSLTVLSLHDNQLSTLPKGIFRGLSSLERLFLDDNELSALPKEIFVESDSLQYLGMSGNRLSTLPVEIFGGTSTLQNLGLGDNRLSGLPEDIFRGLSSLEQLHLHNNQLAELPEEIFRGLDRLSQLWLHGNRLAALPEGVFHGLDNLALLRLHGNRLATLPEGIFRGLGSLSELVLHHNQLPSLPSGIFQGLGSLEQLFLSHNRLSALPSQIFGELDSLRHLFLGHNRLTNLPPEIFGELSSLQQLFLDHNQLSTLPPGIFEGLSSLTRLFLDHNRLSTLSSAVFSGLNSLRGLFLNHNHLAALPAGTLSDLNHLVSLSLRDNPLRRESLLGTFDEVLDTLNCPYITGWGASIQGVLDLDLDLRATLAFASTEQRASPGDSIKVPVTLSRALPLAVRVPYSVSPPLPLAASVAPAAAGSAPSDDYRNLSPPPSEGLLFLAGETRKEITFTLAESADDQDKFMVLTLSEVSEIGLRRSDGTDPDTSCLDPRVFLSRPNKWATHTVTITGSGSGGTDPDAAENLFVPVLLTAAGRNHSFFTSEMTLTNRGAHPATLHYTYTAHAGGGSGAGSDILAPGRQKIQPDAIDYLMSLGIPIPDSGSRIGTLGVKVSGASGVGVMVRTTTAVPEGRAGLAYPGVPAEAGFQEAVYLCGLRQNRQDRSNIAFQNMGTAKDGSITLRATVFSGEVGDTGARVLKDVRLGPGGFHQYSRVLGVLGSEAHGYVKVERVEGTAPFYAYGVINDQANSDGSFVFPVTAGSLEASTGQTLPVVVETGVFSSELTVTNFSEDARNLILKLVADAIDTEADTATVRLLIEAGEQLIIPGVVASWRQQGVGGIAQTRGSLAGPLFASAVEGDLSGIVVGARTGSQGVSGHYSVFYNAVPFGESFTETAWVDALQQNEENRSNLALVNTGEVDDSDSVFSLDIYDGETGRLVNTVTGRRVAPGAWYQINSILGNYAPDTTQGYVRIRRISGNNPFLAYGVVNDGGAPGQRSSDGAYLPARR